MAQLKWHLIFLAFLYYQSNVEANSTVSTPTFNGVHALPKQFPYQVFIQAQQRYTWSQGCSGVIISNRIILTTASCVSGNAFYFKIYIGAVDVSGSRENHLQSMYVEPKNVKVHPEYDAKQHLNDIAIIKIPADLQFDEFIQPVQLPEENELCEQDNCIITIWESTQRCVSDVTELVYANVTVMSNEECKSVAQKYSPAIFYPSSWLCIRPGRTYICHKHKGSPLVKSTDDGSNILLGLASFKVSEGAVCEANHPAIFTRIASYLQWIKQN